MKRITVVTGHFGSGKTEFSVNLAMGLSSKFEKVALIDLDIANPYFRSRERQEMLEAAGVNVFYNTFGYDITEDLPAISAILRAPLEDEEYTVIVDVGGNDSGSRVLKQFKKYFESDDCQMLCVMNANRPETDSADGMINHINSIESETGLVIHGLVNNTHMLMETEPEDVLFGYELCSEVSQKTDKPVLYNTCREDLIKKLEFCENCGNFEVYPLKLYMRPTWLDL